MSTALLDQLQAGVVIPAHPLALGDDGRVDQHAQQVLSRYYLAAGADGLAVGVHTTQFALHRDRGLLAEVWRLAAETATQNAPNTLLVAGVCGDVEDAQREATLAADAGYHAALLCPWGMRQADESALLACAAAVGQVLPTIGFYLQESVGGRPLRREFWRKLFDLDSLVAVKTAPFNRYRTNDVAQALLEHDRWDQVALLTGNDDAIVHDLLTPYRRTVAGQLRQVWTSGGLLGQWAVGTRAARVLLSQIREARDARAVPVEVLAAASELVEINAAVFDVDHDFAGSIAGVNETLRQQGLIRSARCLDDHERLSPGQADKITQARLRYPDWLDEQFVAEHKNTWTS